MQSKLVELIVKTMLPSALRAALAAATGLLLAHAGVLAAYGVNYDPVTEILSISLKTFKEWLTVGAGFALIGGLIKGAQHTATKAVQPKEELPQ